MEPATEHQHAHRPADGDASGRPTHAARAPRATLLRVLVALAVAVSAVVHLVLWQDGMRDVDVVGPGFLANGIGGIALAVAVVAWRHPLPLLGAIAFGAATLGAYAMSMTVGFFGVREQVWSPEAVVSAVTEVAAIVLGVAALVVERRRA